MEKAVDFRPTSVSSVLRDFPPKNVPEDDDVGVDNDPHARFFERTVSMASSMSDSLYQTDLAHVCLIEVRLSVLFLRHIWFTCLVR